jgi:hypothetical protein
MGAEPAVMGPRKILSGKKSRHDNQGSAEEEKAFEVR